MKKVILILLFFPVFVLSQEKININTATLEQLDILIGIGPTYAQRIIDNRPFSSVDDLLRVNGIGEKTLEKIKEQKLAYVEEKPVETTPMPTIEPMKEVKPPPYVDVEKIEIRVEDGPRTFPSGIIINEILPSPEGSDSENEWIELYNQNDFDIDLNNWTIKDTTGSIKEYILETKIPRLGYLLLKRPETKITLNNDSDGLILMNPNKEIVDSVNFGKALQGQSYNRYSSEWSWTITPTPEEQNVIVKKSTPQPKQANLTGSKNQESAEVGPPQILRNKLVNSFEDFPGISVFLIGFIVAIFCSIAFLIIKSNIRGFWY
ncbi:helix-hairpin-helix domain-containing protein [Patescibacteria group bacterium]|nr:helix-hairpin-helix domain-containing protein [Patescibacteria group bacterium]